MKHIRSLILAFALMAGIAPAFAQVPPPVPALPDTERRTTYSISASTCACAVGFQLYGDSTDYTNWIEVWINGARITQAGNWTITSPTGSLATIPRPISDAVLTFTAAQTGTVQIVGARRPRRTSQFSESRGVAARDLNQALSDIVAQNRETWDKINDVSGRAVLAPPGETLNVLSTATSRASSGACFDAGGQLVSCVSIPSTTFTAGNGIAITGTSPKTITNNIQATAPIVISGTNPLTVSCPTCNTAPATASPAVFLATRSAAAGLDLHTYSVVRTGGYTSGGDGGGALFKNVGSAPFLDSNVNSGSLTAPGSAYTNGTYLGIPLTGGTGTGLTASITVAGGVVTGVTVTGTGGNGYTVGDVLSATAASIGGTGSGFTWTVSGVTSPLGSFTDSIGTRFQIVPEGYISIRQFGAKIDYAGTDGSATDDQGAIQAALRFAGRLILPTFDGGGSAGSTVYVPRGTAKVCGGLQVPVGVTVLGDGPVSSYLKQCDSDAASVHFVTLCDPASHTACFGTSVRNLGLFTGSGAANSNIAMIYTNSAQQLSVAENVTVYSGKRSCLFADTGFGGAANLIIKGLFCTISSLSVNNGISITYGAAVITLKDIIVESGAATTANGIFIGTGAVVSIDGWHSENVATPIFINVSGSTITNIRNVTGGVNCTSLITRQAASVTNQIRAGSLYPNGCTNTINNAGTATTGLVVTEVTF